VTPLLDVRDVAHAFGGVRAVDGATFDVEAGSITGLIGPNGAGKSTLFNCISGFLRPRSGRVSMNVMLATPRHPGERLGRLGRSRAREAEARAAELLALVGLDGHAQALAGTLSGGQRKLLDLIRALMAEPRLLLLDEPMAGVNPTTRVQLLQHIRDLRDRDGITLLIVEHDLDFIMGASDRVIVMNDGRVIADATPEEVRGDERVVDAYLGARHEAA
jgi:neutral amino acid transport system ATP-binding protein